MTLAQGIQLTALGFGLVGTWMVAFGLGIHEGISRRYRKQLHLKHTDIVPSEVHLRPWLLWCGLVAITVGALLQAVYIICF